MAEVTTKTGGSKSRRKILSTRVDLTPMVDLGFLLITFFIITTSLQEPKMADLIMPKDTKRTTKIKESTVMTIILSKDDNVDYYYGELDTAIIHHSNFQTIRKRIQEKKIFVKNAVGSADETVIIIKPSAQSSYKNLVDILDEIMINDISHYFLGEVTEAKIKEAIGEN